MLFGRANEVNGLACWFLPDFGSRHSGQFHYPFSSIKAWQGRPLLGIFEATSKPFMALISLHYFFYFRTPLVHFELLQQYFEHSGY
jgi:hypothetical protein